MFNYSTIDIPESELKITFARSGGAGGQNVNKVESKAILHWKVGESSVFDEDEKERIREKLANRLNNEDEIVIMAEAERSQEQNRSNAIKKLHELVGQALHMPKKRKPTKPSRAAKEKRLTEKKKRSVVKQNRKPPTLD